MAHAELRFLPPSVLDATRSQLRCVIDRKVELAAERLTACDEVGALLAAMEPRASEGQTIGEVATPDEAARLASLDARLQSLTGATEALDAYMEPVRQRVGGGR
jgi:hypothetical protein